MPLGRRARGNFRYRRIVHHVPKSVRAKNENVAFAQGNPIFLDGRYNIQTRAECLQNDIAASAALDSSAVIKPSRIICACSVWSSVN